MSKKNILLLHGALGTKTQFSSLISMLEDRFTVHTMDFEGHGNLPILERPFRVEHFAENVLEYLNNNSLTNVDVFGYSMGGYISLYLAIQKPERIRSIFTMATKFHWSPEIAAREVKMLDAEKIQQKVPHFAKALKQQHGDKWKVVLEKTAEMMQSLGTNKVFTPEQIQHIPCCVRIGLGDKDTMVSLEESIEVYRLLKKGELEVFPNTLHPIEKISSQKLASSISNFFS